MQKHRSPLLGTSHYKLAHCREPPRSFVSSTPQAEEPVFPYGHPHASFSHVFAPRVFGPIDNSWGIIPVADFGFGEYKRTPRALYTDGGERNVSSAVCFIVEKRRLLLLDLRSTASAHDTR